MKDILSVKIALPLLAMALALAGPASAEPQQLAANATAEARFVVLEGGRNFRDLGGYRTADGHTVKPGLVYRSGSLGTLTPVGQRQLANLHVASIVDLRTTQERATDTFDLKASYPGYWTRDYTMSLGDMRAVFADPNNLTADRIKAMMVVAYRKLPKEQAASYRQLFLDLRGGRGATVMNCTAGKDRTGVAAALVLTALGVPYTTIRDDFLLSNGAPGMDGLLKEPSTPLGGLPAEAARALVGVDGTYLDAAFDQIRQDYGSVEAYLQTELGVSPRDIRVLRKRLLSRNTK